MELQVLRNEILSIMRDKKYRSFVKRNRLLEINITEEYEDALTFEVSDRFATYQLGIDFNRDGSFDMRSVITSTAYDDIDGLVGIGDEVDELGLAECDFKSDIDVEDAVDEIFNLMLDDGSIESMYKEFAKIESKIENLVDTNDGIANNQYVLSKFLINLGYLYE